MTLLVETNLFQLEVAFVIVNVTEKGGFTTERNVCWNIINTLLKGLFGFFVCLIFVSSVIWNYLIWRL